jgi:hypothetical protein
MRTEPDIPAKGLGGSNFSSGVRICSSWPKGEPMEFGKSWLDKLSEAQAEMAAPKDPWKLRLERMRGKIDYDGLERVTTQMLFDVLEVPQRSRTAGACRRLAAVMTKLGWTAARVRGLTRGGYREQVRGYCRDARDGRHSNS